MAGAQGLGQGVGQSVGSQFPQQSMMSGGLGNQYPVTPSIGQSLPDMPSSVQRMPGGFGLSPQLLQMIASLQARNPKFVPQAPPPSGPFGGQVQQIRNPYSPNGYGAQPGVSMGVPGNYTGGLSFLRR
jgi:hypothetical protein